MDILKTKNQTVLTVALSGRLDTATAPMLESVVKEELNDVKTLTIDLANLEYISSAGLRVLLAAQKQMNRQGEMFVKNVNESVKEIFDITGFSDILQIQ